MKEKISLTLNQKTISLFEIEMKRHRQMNKSKFAEFLFNQVLQNTEQRYKLLQARLDNKRAELRILNEELLLLQERLEEEAKFKEKFQEPIECEHPGVTERQW